MKDKLLVLFLTIAMTITMLPLSVFAEEPAWGSKENPCEVDYYQKQYSGYAYVENSKQIWFVLNMKAAAKLKFVASELDSDIKSVEILDKDYNKIDTFDYNSDDDTYESELIDLEKQTYYFRIKYLNETDHDIRIESYTGVEPVKHVGTLADPIILEGDDLADYDQYFTDDIILEEDTTELYYQLDAGKDAYCEADCFCFKEILVNKIELMDSDKKTLGEFKPLYYDENDDDMTYIEYNLRNFKLEKGKRYYIKVTFDKAVSGDDFSINIYQLNGNGMKDNPFTANYNDSEYMKSYYGMGEVFDGYNEFWFKAVIQEDTKIRPYAYCAYADESEYDDEIDDFIDCAYFYVNDEAEGRLMEYNRYPEYIDTFGLEDYVEVKAGDVVYVKVVTNDKANDRDDLYIDLECFGINDSDIEIELSCDSFTYNGKEHCPTIKSISYKDKVLEPGVDYETAVVYNFNTNIGWGEVEITGLGEYYGKTWAYFRINPKSTRIKSLVAGDNSVTVNWNPLLNKMSSEHITGYKIEYSTSKNFNNSKTVRVKGYKKASKKIKNLKNRKKYYVRICTYYRDSYGTYECSDWSAVKTVKTH